MNEQQHQQPPLSPSSSSEGGAEGQAHDQGRVLALEIAEAPERLTKRLDVAQIIDGMQRGVLVELTISRPRFTVALAGKRKASGEMIGLEKIGLILSEEAQRILADYFTLGRHSLLPKRWQEELNTAETAARRNLANYSVKTHWGAFITAGAYPQWKVANERYKEQFFALKERIGLEYDTMRATVEADYRRLAEDAWAHSTFGHVALQTHHGDVSQAMITDLTKKLSEEQQRALFIERYMHVIEPVIPTREEIEASFVYETALSYIPLPSQLAREHAIATVRMREQLLQDEAAQAELAISREKQRVEVEISREKKIAEMEVIQAKKLAEIEEVTVQQRVAQIRQRNELAQATMERDVIERAKEQKEQLVAEFYEDIVQQMNTKIAQTCSKTLESLAKNEGVLRGPVADSLRDLVKWLENLNIVEDQQIEEQIAKLREVLPSQHDRDQARKGVARIDTSRMQAAITQLEEQAEQTLMELELSQSPRTARRNKPLTLDEDTLLVTGEEAPRARRAMSKSAALPEISRRRKATPH